MSSFLKPKKSPTNIDTTFVCPDLAVQDLDKKYMMNMLPDVTMKKAKTTAVQQSTSTASLFKNNLKVRDEKSEQKTALSFRLQSKNLVKEKESILPTIVTHTLADAKNIAQHIIVVPDVKNAEYQSADVCCWYCRLLIPQDIYPIPLPVSVHKTTEGKNKYQGEGYFCSFNCQMSYVNEYCVGQHRYKSCGTLINLLYQDIFESNIMLKQINPSPSWKLLKMFGGYMSNEEYRKHIQINRYLPLKQYSKEAIHVEIHPEMFQEIMLE